MQRYRDLNSVPLRFSERYIFYNLKPIRLLKMTVRAILNDTLETLNPLSVIKKVESFFCLEKCLFLWVSLFLLINKKCVSHFCKEPANEKKHLKKHKKWYLTWNYAYSLFKSYFISLKTNQKSIKLP